jgi:hypothetical protein
VPVSDRRVGGNENYGALSTRRGDASVADGARQVPRRSLVGGARAHASVALRGRGGPCGSRAIHGALTARGVTSLGCLVDTDVVVSRRPCLRRFPGRLLAASADVRSATYWRIASRPPPGGTPGFFSQCRILVAPIVHPPRRSVREAATFWAGLGAVLRTECLFRCRADYDGALPARPFGAMTSIWVFRLRNSAGHRIVARMPASKGTASQARGRFWSFSVRDRCCGIQGLIPWTSSWLAAVRAPMRQQISTIHLSVSRVAFVAALPAGGLARDPVAWLRAVAYRDVAADRRPGALGTRNRQLLIASYQASSDAVGLLTLGWFPGSTA